MVERVEVILPKRSMDALSNYLVALTAAIDGIAPDTVAHGCLGGAHRYGAHWDSDVFEMRPFYWGDCDCGAEEREDAFWSTHSHAPDCYQTELHSRIDAYKAASGRNATYDKLHAFKDDLYLELRTRYNLPEYGCAVHCTCGVAEKAKSYFAESGHFATCAGELPNFRHKATGFEVRWYKYIGRGMEIASPEEPNLPAIFADCMAALAPPNPRSREHG